MAWSVTKMDVKPSNLVTLSSVNFDKYQKRKQWLGVCWHLELYLLVLTHHVHMQDLENFMQVIEFAFTMTPTFLKTICMFLNVIIKISQSLT